MTATELKDFLNQNNFFHSQHKIRILTLQEGYSEVEMQADPMNCNYMGYFHGGLLYSLGDIAACICVMTNGFQCVTLNGSSNFFKAINKGKVIAIAQQVHGGSKIRVCEVKIYDETKALVCTGTFTVFVTDTPLEIS